MAEPVANPERGEVEIHLVYRGQKKTFVLRPSWTAMKEIETASGKGLLSLAKKAQAFDLGYTEMAVIITAALRAGGEPADFDKVGEMLFETGIAEVNAAVQRFLTNAMTGGAKKEPAQGEAKAADGAT